MHHIFANQKAIDGHSSGDFSDGTVIVHELHEAQQKHGVISESDRKRVDVMIKDPSLKDAGGWRFERFWGNDRTRNAIYDSGASYFQCHSKANAHGMFFSRREALPETEE
jgi:hypothetical protein